MVRKQTERRSTVCQLWPLLAVRDINRSVQFYCDQLDFELAGDNGKPGEEMSWCRLKPGGASIMLQQFPEEDGEE